MKEQKGKTFANKLKKVTTVISWIVFTVLIICAVLLVYYFVATKIYEKKGKGYEPIFSLYTIISPSMEPTIKVYDVVVDTKVSEPSDIKVGDVITYNSTDFSVGKSISVTHRVVAVNVDQKGNYSYTTKGDNNDTKDPKNVPFENITGKVLMAIPQLGRVQFFIATKSGWLLVVVIPALYIIIKDILKIFKIVKPNSEKKKGILFKPIKKKQLYLPFHGYRNEEGQKEKFTVSSLVPFTFEKNNDEIEKPVTNNETTNIETKTDVTLESIYSDLKDLADDEKK